MTIQFTVPDMACSACSTAITQAIQAIDATATVQADPQTKRVEVNTQATETAIRAAIATAGYTIAD